MQSDNLNYLLIINFLICLALELGEIPAQAADPLIESSNFVKFEAKRVK